MYKHIYGSQCAITVMLMRNTCLSKVHCVIVSFAPEEEVEEEEQEEGRTLRDCLDAFFLFAFASP